MNNDENEWSKNIASQAEGREFESRFPLKMDRGLDFVLALFDFPVVT